MKLHLMSQAKGAPVPLIPANQQVGTNGQPKTPVLPGPGGLVSQSSMENLDQLKLTPVSSSGSVSSTSTSGGKVSGESSNTETFERMGDSDASLLAVLGVAEYCETEQHDWEGQVDYGGIY